MEFSARYLDRLRRMIRSLAGGRFSEDEIDDALGETVERIFRSVGRFRPTREGALLSWACTIARNVVMDAFRARRSAEFVSFDEAAERLGAPGLGYVSRLREADFDRLGRAIGDLVPRDQALIALYRAGRTDAETAVLLGLREDQVRKVRYKALQRLKKRYEDVRRREMGGGGRS